MKLKIWKMKLRNWEKVLGKILRRKYLVSLLFKKIIMGIKKIKNFWEITEELKEKNDELEKALLDMNNEVARLRWFIAGSQNTLKIYKESIISKSYIDKIYEIIFVIFMSLFLVFPFLIFLKRNSSDSSSLVQLDNIEIFSALMSPILVWLVIFYLWKIDSLDLSWDRKNIKTAITYFCIFILCFIIMFYFLFEKNINTL